MMQSKSDKKIISHPDPPAGTAAPPPAYREVAFDPEYPVPAFLLRPLKGEYLRRELWVPLEWRDGRICVLIDDPQNILKRDAIESLLKTRAVEYCVAAPEEILLFIDHFFRAELPAAGRSKGEVKKGERGAVTEADRNIVKLVDDVIDEAYRRRASDIHFEPDIGDRMVHCRFRIDGECLLFKSYPYEYRSAIVSRIKIMSNLDITERRLPQDGKIKHRTPDAGEIELRVATIPTQGYVEDVVLRILTRGVILTLDELQMPPEVLAQFKAILKKPYGLILLVGPTGSGKTTTAHAALHMLNRPNVKIWTVEDPVEITQKGIRQVQVHHKIGLDFSNAMRAFLRADPDIIMVGEMRDFETAKMGVDASTTGHLVLSTLHTNNAPETIIRLLDMGIDPFSFADSLLCVLAQRLVRALCPECREPYHPGREEYDELARHYGERAFAQLNVPYDEKFTLYRPKGCPACNGMGYRGMMGVFELLTATDNIKQMIITRKSMAAIRKAAAGEGMTTLLQGGILRILKGETDLIEVLSICMR
ncbi:MAG: GspE/PulE family protein [Deltaproteobacteria bacterium]|nr:GspE/PulE family protein [Deltaproteobacteria bacterium]